MTTLNIKIISTYFIENEIRQTLVRINRHFVKYRPFEAVFLYAALENFDCYLAGGLYYNHNQTRPLNGLVLESVNVITKLDRMRSLLLSRGCSTYA